MNKSANQGILLDELKLPALVEHSIKLLRLHQPTDAPYYGCFSGGKDSCVIKALAAMAGVNVVWYYNVTTIDPPELIYFIREHHKDVVWEKPKHGNFFARMSKVGFPTRRNRWCCREYKETASPVGSVVMLGVRSAESPRRAAAWKDVTFHRVTKAWAVSPILHWSDNDVWRFIHANDLPYCSLYDEGFKRLGCVGCPQGRKARGVQFKRWPRMEAGWKRAFQRLHATPDRKGVQRWATWEDMWDWWMNDDAPLPKENEEEDSCAIALDMLSGGTE